MVINNETGYLGGEKEKGYIRDEKEIIILKIQICLKDSK